MEEDPTSNILFFLDNNVGTKMTGTERESRIDNLLRILRQVQGCSTTNEEDVRDCLKKTNLGKTPLWRIEYLITVLRRLCQLVNSSNFQLGHFQKFPKFSISKIINFLNSTISKNMKFLKYRNLKNY